MLAVLLLLGCKPTGSYLRRYQEIRPSRYTILLPAGREGLPCISRFAENKRRLGFSVELVAFTPGGTPAERFEEAWKLLAERAATHATPAYLLILATHEELPMGPWMLPGEPEEEFLSDIPLTAPWEMAPPETLSEDSWRIAASPPGPWITGRPPYDNTETIEAALGAAVCFESPAESDPPQALLGAERFAVWADSAIVMSRARAAFRRAGWKGELWSQDPPRDRPTGTARRTVELPRPQAALEADRKRRGPLRSVVTTYTPTVSMDFLTRWAELSPRVVYAIAHASIFRGGVGKDLVDGDNMRALDLDPMASIGPASPAIFVSTGCLTGYPGNTAIVELFRRGWIAGFVGCTIENGPSPLIPAVRAEVNIAYFLARGLPLGLAVQATKEAYASESLRAPGHWFFPSTRRLKRSNLLSYVIYGDPSLAARPQPLVSAQ